MNDKYYYTGESGETAGPVPLSEILKEIEGGWLPMSTRVTRGGDDLWISVGEAQRREVRQESESKTTFEQEMSKFKSSPINIKSSSPSLVSSILKIIGFLSVIIGGFCLVVGILGAGNDAFILTVAGFSSFFSGMLFFAFSEVLDRLREIADKLR